MTNEEIELLKTSILDTVETYVDTVVQRLPFVKTEIGVISGVGTEKGNKVKVKKTATFEGVEYDNILSVGNIIFPNDCVVYLFVPNGQYTNMFIMGQLDDTPANIKGGRIEGAEIVGNTISGGTVNGTNITGSTISGNTISGGTISGTTVSGGTVSGSVITSVGQKIFKASDYTNADIDIMRNIMLGITPITNDLLEKYDFDGDSVITTQDIVSCRRLVDRIDQQIVLNTSVTINPTAKSGSIITKEVYISPSGVKSKVLNATDRVISKQYYTYYNNTDVSGVSGSFVDKNGKTILVSNGLVIGITP